MGPEKRSLGHQGHPFKGNSTIPAPLFFFFHFLAMKWVVLLLPWYAALPTALRPTEHETSKTLPKQNFSFYLLSQVLVTLMEKQAIQGLSTPFVLKFSLSRCGKGVWEFIFTDAFSPHTWLFSFIKCKQ